MPQSIADELKSLPMSSNLGESLERAHRFAREQTHRLVTLEHLLLALTEDPEAALILQAANVDLARLRTDVSSYLGRLLEDSRAEPGAEPRPDPELLRVLQAAASAALQSKRKQIDGAIVLAAVVGDGKSPAAGTLKSHGMTFEEAIRALQRANTQARLKTPTKTAAKASGTPAAAKAPEKPEPAPKPASAKAGGDPGSLSARLAGGSADDILAAARARIQQRASGGAPDGAGDAPEEAASPAQAQQTPSLQEALQAVGSSEPPQQQGSSAFEELLAVSTAAKADAAPEPYSQAPEQQDGRGSRQGWAPSPDMRQQGPARAPQGPPARGQRQQPMPPQRGAPRQGSGPAPGYPNRPARAPWPEPGEHNGQMRPLGPNGNMGGHYPDTGAPAQAARPASAQRASAQAGGDRGPLVENVPRRMRVGVGSKAEVRIARDRIEGLVVALNGQGMPHRSDHLATRALSVRLKAPNGGFSIEAVTPETQWVDGATGIARDEYAIWRWTVTPQRRGRGRLLLTVSARTVGQEGLAAELAPPDRQIEIRVAPNRLRRIGRLMLWLMLIAAGAALGRYSDKVLATASALLKKAMEMQGGG